MNVLITGVSSGLGLGFAKAAKDQGARVYGVSRRDCPIALDGFANLDLTDFDQIEACVKSLLSGLTMFPRSRGSQRRSAGCHLAHEPSQT